MELLEGLSIEERLQALADAGELTRPSLPKGDWTPLCPTRSKAASFSRRSTSWPSGVAYQAS
jgi:hypothetical protein